MENANEILFHPSGMSDVMSGVAKGWSVDKSLTCKKKLVSIFREQKYGRRYSFSSKFTEKGTRMEEDGITLYSRFTKKLLKKNLVTFNSDYFLGHPDILNEADEVIDIKCPWSLDTLPSLAVDSIDKDYEYQVNAYLDLTGKSTGIIAYCLVNAPANIIDAEKRSMYFRMGEPDKGDKNLIKALSNIEKNMIFDLDQFCRDNPNYEFSFSGDWIWDIPLEERVVEYKFQKNEELIKAMKTRIDECRQWMQTNLLTPEQP